MAQKIYTLILHEYQKDEYGISEVTIEAYSEKKLEVLISKWVEYLDKFTKFETDKLLRKHEFKLGEIILLINGKSYNLMENEDDEIEYRTLENTAIQKFNQFLVKKEEELKIKIKQEKQLKLKNELELYKKKIKNLTHLSELKK